MSSSPNHTTEASFSMPFGTCLDPEKGVVFRLWAPQAETVELCLAAADKKPSMCPMTRDEDDWFLLHHDAASTGDLYQFRIDGGLKVPDPASRHQAYDIHGPSIVCNPSGFHWQDHHWHGRPWEEAVIYEIHVGTFTAEGTFRALAGKLDYLVDLGVTAVELMPVAQFPGGRNWGYDGALLFAVHNGYGSPEDLKTLVQTAHGKGLMVFLDVVYNHFGPEGNYLYVYARDTFFTSRFTTPWGEAINYCGSNSRTVRDFFIANALYWLEEFHFDGLRFDAVHAIFDDSTPHILEEISRAVKDGPARSREIHLVLENDNNCSRFLVRQAGTRPRHFTAQWNDDIHHACHVLLTEEDEGYYEDYSDSPIDHLGRCLSEGFAYQGERSPYRQGRCRGETSSHLPPQSFVSFLQNHDQVGNRAMGERLIRLCDMEELRLCISLLLLAPSPPLLFMGEEFGATTPFLFFCDFGEDLAESITNGRREEFRRFASFTSASSRRTIPDPGDYDTFARSKVDWREAAGPGNRALFSFYRELLRLRKEQIVPRLAGMTGGQSGCQVISSKAIYGWWRLTDEAHLRVRFNLHGNEVACPALQAGEVELFRSGPAVSGGAREAMLPSRSIHWHLQEGKRCRKKS